MTVKTNTNQDNSNRFKPAKISKYRHSGRSTSDRQKRDSNNNREREDANGRKNVRMTLNKSPQFRF